MGDRRAAGQPQRHAHLGGDDHRQRGLAEAGRAGEQHVVGGPAPAPGGLEHQPELGAHPGLADDLVEGAGAQRRLDGTLVALGLGRGQRAEVGLLGGGEVRVVGVVAVGAGQSRAALHAHALLSVRRAARSSAATSGAADASASGATASTARSASLTDQPRPTRPCWTWPRQRRLGGRQGVRAGVADRGADAVLELEDDPLGALLADAGHPGEGLDVVGGDRRRSSSGPSTASIAWASLGPTPEAVCTSSKTRLLVLVEEAEQREGVLADHHARGQQWPRWPVRSVASVPGVHISSRPTPPTSSTALVSADGGDLAADEGDHGCPPVTAGRRARAASMRAWAPPRQMWVMARASASAASAGLRRRVEAQDPGDHGADLGLVGAAAAGDRGLDLAGGVQRDRAARAGRRRPSRCRWPGRCP